MVDASIIAQYEKAKEKAAEFGFNVVVHSDRVYISRANRNVGTNLVFSSVNDVLNWLVGYEWGYIEHAMVARYRKYNTKKKKK